MIDKEFKYNISTLDNGIKVLTESESFPGLVHMGIQL